jgi:SRSO17 transposase
LGVSAQIGAANASRSVLVRNEEGAALAAVHRIDPDRWWDGFGALMDRIRPRFARYEPARHAGALVSGLLSGLDRKNCWTIAERRGDASPDGLQHLLSRAKWDADLVRDDLRSYVVEAFGDPAGILVVDETGDLKKGTRSVAVQRQYTGTAGRIENAQVAVYLTYAGPRGHALIDRALYLPKSWTGDPARCAAAGVPAGVEFATKPALAQQMILAALDAGVPAEFVTGDEVYGNDPKLRAALARRGVGYVLAVACDHRVPGPLGPLRADRLVASLPPESWRRLSAGAGTKGPRFYSWALVTVAVDQPGAHRLLVRRNDTTKELAYYRCWTPEPVPLDTLVRVAGQRWKTEEAFQSAKGQAGLDEHQVRRWCSWHRWTTLAMLAMAFLAVTTAAEKDRAPAPSNLIPLTLNELRRLFDALVLGATATPEHVLKWSIWRRKHQETARRHHYRRRSEALKPELRL